MGIGSWLADIFGDDKPAAAARPLFAAFAPGAVSALRSGGYAGPHPRVSKAGAMHPDDFKSVSSAFAHGMPPEIHSALQAAGVAPGALADIPMGVPMAQDKGETVAEPGRVLQSKWASGTATVTPKAGSGSAPLRDSGSFTSHIIKQVPAGTQVRVVSSVTVPGKNTPDAWVQVALADGATGWMHEEVLSAGAGSAPVGLPDPGVYPKPMPSGSDPIVGPAYPFLSHWTYLDRRSLYDTQIALGMDPAKGGLVGLIWEESKGDPMAMNPLPAGGIIQLTKGANLDGFKTDDAIRGIAGMSIEDQLERIVKPLYKRFHGNYGDESLASFMLLNSGVGVGHADDFKWGDSKGDKTRQDIYAAHAKSYDKAGKGYITVGDIIAKGNQIAGESGGKWITVSGKIVSSPGASAPAPDKAKTMAAVAARSAAIKAKMPSAAPILATKKAVIAKSKALDGRLPQAPRKSDLDTALEGRPKLAALVKNDPEIAKFVAENPDLVAKAIKDPASATSEPKFLMWAATHGKEVAALQEAAKEPVQYRPRIADDREPKADAEPAKGDDELARIAAWRAYADDIKARASVTERAAKGEPERIGVAPEGEPETEAEKAERLKRDALAKVAATKGALGRGTSGGMAAEDAAERARQAADAAAMAETQRNAQARIDEASAPAPVAKNDEDDLPQPPKAEGA